MQYLFTLRWKHSILNRRLGRQTNHGLLLALMWVVAVSATALAANSTTTMTVTSGGSPVSSVPQGAVVTLTASVMSSSTPVTAGQVNFCDAAAAHCSDIHLLASAQLTNAGTAAFKFHPGPGSHSYKAVFVATTADAASSSAASPLSVTAPAKLPTTTTIAQSGDHTGYTLTATVYGNGSTAPTGTVSFLDTSNANATVATATLGAGSGFGFMNASNPAVGGGAIAAADFNRDGIPDLVVSYLEATSSPGSVAVLLGNGDGTFSNPTAYPATGNDPESIAVGDLNGDGNLDVAAANAGSNTVTVLLGDGTGTFTAVANSPQTGADPVSIVAGDWNQDGVPDLAVANANSSTVTVLLGIGDGTFTPTTASPATGYSPYAIASGDFNGDGKPDLATANNNSNTVTILLGNGDGTFTPAAASPATGNNPNAIAVADFNGDGKMDLAVSNLEANSGGTITVLLGNGDGTFTPTTASPATGGNADSIAAGDWNGDGVADLAVANQLNNTLTILLGAGDGTFTPAITSPATGIDPSGLAVADLNGDGLEDLVVSNTGNFPNGPASPGLTALLAANQVTTATATNVTIPTLGPHLVDASYPGDSNYGASVSATTALTGPTITTALVLTANPSNSVVAGGTVTLTATLSPSTYQSQNSNGETVTFLLNGNVMGTGTLSGGVATYILTSTAGLQSAGQVTFGAKYSGDNYLSGSQSNDIPFTVTSGVATTLALTVTPTTFTYISGSQDSIALTATLSPASYEGVSSDGSTVLFNYSGEGGEQGGSGQVAGTLSSGVAAASAFGLPAGVYSVQASFSATTSFAPSTSPTVTVTVNKATPTVSLTSSANPAPSGTSVTITAAVAYQYPAQPGQQSETVTFYDGATQIGISPIVLGQSAATFSTSSLSPGSHSITAQYSGDIDNLPATSAPLNQSIGNPTPVATTLVLQVAPNPAAFGGQVNMTATLTPFTSQGVTANGVVTFTYSNTTGYTSAVQANLTNGVATTTGGVYGLQAGTYQVVATYPGNTVFQAPPPATVTLIVNKNSPAVTLTSSSNPAIVGTMVTFTAAVPVFPTPSQEPNEIVTFYDGATPLGMSVIGLSGGSTTFITSALPAGTHSITAVYGGDTNNSSSTSAALSQVITSAVATPTITLTSSANPASVSTAVTFTASLASAAGTPSGSIEFYDGTTQLGAATVTAGSATYSIATLIAGAHTITAVYSGDSNFSSVTSSALTETIETFMLDAPGGGNISAQTASPGGEANYMLAVGPPSGSTFPATVTFSVTGLPSGATASFSPPSLPQNSTATNVTMTVTLPSNAAVTHPLTGLAPIALALVFLPFAGRMRKVARTSQKRAWMMVFVLAGVVLAAGLTACGSGSSGMTGGGGGTPQTYTLTVTATSGSLSQTTITTLTVQ